MKNGSELAKRKGSSKSETFQSYCFLRSRGVTACHARQQENEILSERTENGTLFGLEILRENETK